MRGFIKKFRQHTFLLWTWGYGCLVSIENGQTYFLDHKSFIQKNIRIDDGQLVEFRPSLTSNYGFYAEEVVVLPYRCINAGMSFDGIYRS